MDLNNFLLTAQLSLERIEEAEECEIINNCLIIKKSECERKFNGNKDF